MTAHLSAGRAHSLGYENVLVMNEGREGWGELGLPLVIDGATPKESE
jgi:3-mercaptopyruvate sulfurtransferase SseA